MYNVFQEGRVTPERNLNANYYNVYVMRRPRKPRYPYGVGGRTNPVRFFVAHQSNVRRCLYRRHFQTPPRNRERTPTPQPSTSGIRRNPAAANKPPSGGESSEDSPEQPPPRFHYLRGSRAERIMRLLLPENDDLPQLIPISEPPPTPTQSPPLVRASSPISIAAETPPPDIQGSPSITSESSISVDEDISTSELSTSTSQDSGIEELAATRENISPPRREDLARRLILLKDPEEVLTLLKDADLKLFAITLDIEQEFMIELKQFEQTINDAPVIIEISDDDTPDTPSVFIVQGSSRSQIITIESTDSSENALKLQQPISGSKALPESSELNAPSTSKAAVAYGVADTPLSPIENISVSTLGGSPWPNCSFANGLQAEIIPPASPASIISLGTSSNSASASPTDKDVLTTVADVVTVVCTNARQIEAVQALTATKESPENLFEDVPSRSLNTPATTSSVSIAMSETRNLLHLSIISNQRETASMSLSRSGLTSSLSNFAHYSIINDPSLPRLPACSTPKPTSHDINISDVFRGISPISESDASVSSRSIVEPPTVLIWSPELEGEVYRIINSIDVRMRRLHTMLDFIENRFPPKEADGANKSDAKEDAAERPPSTGPPPLVPLPEVKLLLKRERISQMREQLFKIDKELDDDFE